MTALLLGGAHATLQTILAAVRDEGITARGTTNPAEASQLLASGQVTALVIGGGIDPDTRQAMHRHAQHAAVPVVESGLHGRDAVTYVRQDIAPALREVLARPDQTDDTATGPEASDWPEGG